MAQSPETTLILDRLDRVEDKTGERIVESEGRTGKSLETLHRRVDKVGEQLDQVREQTGELRGFTEVLEAKLKALSGAPTANRSRAESGGLTVALVGILETAKRFLVGDG